MKSCKLALVALLGFSTACSTVKEAPKSEKEKGKKAETVPSIVVMYGVRRPVQPSSEVKKADNIESQTQENRANSGNNTGSK